MKVSAQRMADKRYRVEAKRRKMQSLMDEILTNLPIGISYEPEG